MNTNTNEDEMADTVREVKSEEPRKVPGPPDSMTGFAGDSPEDTDVAVKPKEVA